MEKKVMNAKLSDVNGKGNAHMFIESNGADLNMPENFVLANKPHSGKSSKMKEFVTGNPNVGKGSAGFIGVIALASIIAVAGAIIAFFTLRY